MSDTDPTKEWRPEVIAASDRRVNKGGLEPCAAIWKSLHQKIGYMTAQQLIHASAQSPLMAQQPAATEQTVAAFKMELPAKTRIIAGLE